MGLLGARQISGVLLEGGGSLNASALAAGIVDKLVFFLAPKLVGGAASPTPVEGVGIDEMAAAPRLYGLKAFPCGDDLRVEAYLSCSPA